MTRGDLPRGPAPSSLLDTIDWLVISYPVFIRSDHITNTIKAEVLVEVGGA